MTTLAAGGPVAFDGGDSIFAALEPPEPGDVDIQAMIEDAGWEVTAVDWIFEQITGESLVEKVIMPITGDFNKIKQDGNAWTRVGESMRAFGETMKANADTLREDWRGPAAMAHEVYVDAGWKAGFTVEAKIADTVATGFAKVAEGSQKLCEQALKLLKKLVRKLIEAIAESWVPVYGWIRAADMVWSAYQIYQMILQIIEMVKDIISSVQEIFQSLRSIGSQLAKIKDVRSGGDLADVALNVSGEVGDIKTEVGEIKSDAAGIRDTGRDVGTTASDARAQDATTERSAAETEAHRINDAMNARESSEVS